MKININGVTLESVWWYPPGVSIMKEGTTPTLISKHVHMIDFGTWRIRSRYTKVIFSDKDGIKSQVERPQLSPGNDRKPANWYIVAYPTSNKYMQISKEK